MALMKSGWLWRQSSILRRWKRNWFVLWLDGGLVYYQDETQRDLEGRIHIKFNCRDIKTGRECRDVQPPEGKSRDCLMTIVLRDGSKVTLCAESEDDAVAWKMAVLEAKNTPVHMYDPYDDYYQTVPLDSHQTMYVSSGYYGTQYGGLREQRRPWAPSSTFTLHLLLSLPLSAWSDSRDCPRGPLPRVGRPYGFGPAGRRRHRGRPGILHVDAVLVLRTRSPAGRLWTKRLTEKFGFPPGGLRGDALERRSL
ncbi:pleckstrin homology domain-containing family B member 1 isoform X2 [Mauremys mutica]|nr:pleckstrin homology domain-containing family B member 1 isoform X2 [Mauremys mutica]XP_044877961.1 pleckstrin homology domain-containing family B member 1 isoform X2 [Mauremys mutica]XP_044877968.1 pleckstrin homology domain-containing family B member 1 isoform X2 [Mauremys mutica]XP_044877970.1 pleckstrin homology domain-containing family B member 1 isoform X2 [Mauremys mutica]